MICLADIGGPNPKRDFFGWLLVGTVFLSIFINFAIFLYKVSSAAFIKLKVYCKNKEKVKTIKMRPQKLKGENEVFKT